MAQPKTFNGTKLLVQLGDAASPEVFAAPCMINAARGIAFDSTTNDQVVPDCDNPELAAWIERSIDGLTATITGSGVVDTAGLADFWDWYIGGVSKNIRVKVDVPAVDGGGYWSMAAVLQSFNVGGERKQNANFDCNILSDGPVVWVDAT
jgi:hypothetical protein